MATYTAIGDGELLVDKPITESLLNRLRDNPLAIAEGSAGAPKVQSDGMEPVGLEGLHLVAPPLGGTYTNASVTKMAAFRAGRAGSYYTVFDCQRNGGTTATVQMYINSVIAGALHTLSNAGQLYNFEDWPTLVEGDFLQFYASVSGGGAIDFRLGVRGFCTDSYAQGKYNYTNYPGPLGDY